MQKYVQNEGKNFEQYLQTYSRKLKSVTDPLTLCGMCDSM